jgi:hypothetical protein
LLLAVSERTQQNSPDERKHDTHRQHIEPQCNVHVTRSWSWFRVESSRARGQVEAITVLQCRRSRPSRWLELTTRHQGSDRTSKIDASPGIATHHDGFECNTSSRPQQRGKTLRSSGLRAQISATVQILRSGGTQIDASTMTSSAREWRKRRIPGAGRPGLQAQSGQRRTWYPIRRGGSPKNAARFLGCPALPRPLACAAANAGATHASPLTKMRL